MKYYESYQQLDMSDENSVIAYINDNLEDIDMSNDFYYGCMLDYICKYKEVIQHETIRVYRCVMLKNIKDLNINHVGIWWSFEKECAGAYGSVEDRENKTSFILTAVIKVNDIEWEMGLRSHMYYRTDQYECNMIEGSEIIIIEINDEILDNPIEAII